MPPAKQEQKWVAHGPDRGRPAFGWHTADSASSDFPFAEPLIIASPYIDGLMPLARPGAVHFVGWHLVPRLSDSAPGERRVILRFVMSEMEARAFRYTLGFALGEGH